MTYENVIKRGLFCKCGALVLQKSNHDVWGDWVLCGQCRLPVKGSPEKLWDKKTLKGK